METRYVGIEAAVADSDRQSDQPDWEELLASACDTMVRMPPTIMKSIGVTGKLRAVDGEALLLLSTSKRLAAEHGLRETVNLDGRSFTVHFRRREGALPD